MVQTETGDRSRRVVAPALLLGLLVVVALALALLTLTVPEGMVELPVTPTFTDFPMSAHTG